MRCRQKNRLVEYMVVAVNKLFRHCVVFFIDKCYLCKMKSMLRRSAQQTLRLGFVKNMI